MNPATMVVKEKKNTTIKELIETLSAYEDGREVEVYYGTEGDVLIEIPVATENVPEMDIDNDGGIRRVRDNPIPGEGVEFEPLDSRRPKRNRLPGEGVDFEPLDSHLPR